jgi:hypothetical protein
VVHRGSGVKEDLFIQIVEGSRDGCKKQYNTKDAKKERRKVST